MITVRRAAERLHTRAGWLDSRHSFSFGEHYDPRYMSYRALRVLNEDRIQPGHGFGMHPHRDIEIITIVLAGSIRHQDSLGLSGVLHRGDVQRISAGTGVLHSEMNAGDSAAHVIELRIAPDRTRLRPSYQQRHFGEDGRLGRLQLLASPDGRYSSLTLHQDLLLYAATVPPGVMVSYTVIGRRYLWLQLLSGTVTLNDVTVTANAVTLSSGDAAAVEPAALDESAIRISGDDRAELLLIDVA